MFLLFLLLLSFFPIDYEISPVQSHCLTYQQGNPSSRDSEYFVDSGAYYCNYMFSENEMLRSLSGFFFRNSLEGNLCTLIIIIFRRTPNNCSKLRITISIKLFFRRMSSNCTKPWVPSFSDNVRLQ